MMRPLLTLVALAACFPAAHSTEVDSCSTAKSSKRSCLTIQGQLQFWNGWPPALRIEAKNKRRVFGLHYPDDQPLPPALQALFESHTYAADGTFVICPLGGATTVPYDKRPIEIACLKSMDLPSR